jgi:hypothetical protein
MKNIGLISFHRSYNCGSILQAYAMQKTLLEKYNLEPEFIDFSNVGQRELYKVFENNNSIKNICKNVVRLPFYSSLLGNNKSYEKYINKYLLLSKVKYIKLSELKESTFEYDLYLAGSDQIWNITIQDSDDAYFLPFVKNHKKIAYAVSQGARNIVDHTSKPYKYKKMINNFDYISVREPNGQKWLKDGFNIDSKVVLDPTLLLDQKDYKELEEGTTEQLERNKYVFIYATELTKTQEETIRKLAKKEGLKIVVWQPDTWLKKFGWLKGYVLPKKQNPGKYLELMKNAKYVFTASFHGVIFAAQYRKNFWVLENSGMNFDIDDRILSLLKRFGFLDRLLLDQKPFNKISQPINYKKFESALVPARINSFSFLDQALGKVSKGKAK